MRYSEEQKQEVVDFVLNYNKEHGRGGQSAAADKFNTSPISVAKWLKGAGVKGKGKGRAKKKAARATAPKAAPKKKGGRRKKAAVAGRAGSSPTQILNRMTGIAQQIESLNAEYESLKARL